MDTLYPCVISTSKKLAAFNDAVRTMLSMALSQEEPMDAEWTQVVEAIQQYASTSGKELEDFLNRYAKLLKVYLYD